jgi:hypothetical protein
MKVPAVVSYTTSFHPNAVLGLCVLRTQILDDFTVQHVGDVRCTELLHIIIILKGKFVSELKHHAMKDHGDWR